MQLAREQLTHMYRLICQFTRNEIERLPISEIMKTILLESEELRSLRKINLAKAHRSKNESKIPGNGFTCIKCKDLPLKENCVRKLHVRFVDQSLNRGCALVAYATDDPDAMIPKVNLIFIHVSH